MGHIHVPVMVCSWTVIDLGFDAHPATGTVLKFAMGYLNGTVFSVVPEVIKVTHTNTNTHDFIIFLLAQLNDVTPVRQLDITVQVQLHCPGDVIIPPPHSHHIGRSEVPLREHRHLHLQITSSEM